jgi:hypothetical protein
MYRWILGLSLLLSTASACFGQFQDEPAPPPIKMLSKTERSLLNDKPQLKERTSLALELMDARMRSAEKFCTDENYSLMYAELGGFQALIDNTLSYLLKAKGDEGKQLNSLKKFEIGLRGFTPRIEAMRRELPSNFEPYLKYLIGYVSETREKAIEPFFSNSVISN